VRRFVLLSLSRDLYPRRLFLHFITHTHTHTHTLTPQSVGLLWTKDQSEAEASTWQHTTIEGERQPCHRLDSNPQYQQANGRTHTAYTVRPLGSPCTFFSYNCTTRELIFWLPLYTCIWYLITNVCCSSDWTCCISMCCLEWHVLHNLLHFDVLLTVTRPSPLAAFRCAAYSDTSFITCCISMCSLQWHVLHNLLHFDVLLTVTPPSPLAAFRCAAYSDTSFTTCK
jgi:hypothetical protein